MQQKIYLAFMLVVGMAWQLSAQFVPQGFNYQGIIRDDNGAPLANQTASLLFAVRSGAPNGPVAYSERQNVNTNEYGLVNLVVGQGGTPIQGTFAGINWGSGAKYLSIALETSPNVFDDLGTTQLMSVPYALYALSAANGGNDNWGAQVVQTSTEFSGNGTASAPLRIGQQGAENGQVLKWNGAAWTPQDDNGGITQINTGAGLSGGPITNNGTISLSNTGVMPGTYGSAGQIPVITVDAQGRITTVTTINIQSGGGSITLIGGAGIDIQQNGDQYTISNTGDVDPTNDVTNTTQAGGDVNGPFSNLQINAGVVGSTELANSAVTSDKIAADAVNADKIAQDAVGGSEIAAGAVGTAEIADGAVDGAKINDMGAQIGHVLKWNGAIWQPQADNTGGGGGNVNLTAGPGISVTGASPNFTVSNTGDINPTDDLTNTSQSGGDVTGPFANLQLKPDVVSTIELTDNAVETVNLNNGAVTGPKINAMGATGGQVLKFNGATWAPANDLSGSANITAGVAIDVIDNGNGNYVISNAGDIDPFNDITVNTPAGGDLNGFFNNLQINPLAVTSVELSANAVITDKIANGAVTGTKINQMSANPGQVLKWNGSAWTPAQDQAGVGDNWGAQVVLTAPTLSGNGASIPLELAQQGATNGQVLKWDGTGWTPANDLNTGGDNWGAQSAVTNATLTGSGTAGNPLGIAQQGATNGQVLKFNGTSWAPAPDNNDGPDNWGTQTAATSLNIGGNGTAGNPLRIADLGASAGQVLKWNPVQNLWLPANDDNAGPDNWGTQTAVTNATIAGNGTAGNPLGIAQQGATNGQVLKFNGTSWAPAADNDTGGDNWGSQTAFTSLNIGGNGTAGNPLRLADLGASAGQVLKWNPAINLWTPSDDNNSGGNNYAAGSGISITGAAPNFTIVNTGDLSSSNEIQALSLSGNQLTLSNGGGSVTLPPGNSYAAGAGISITGAAPDFTIVNTGDGDAVPTNELQNLSLSGTQLSISNGNTVDLAGIVGGFWLPNGNDIFNANVGNVLIGTPISDAKFQVGAASGTAAYLNATSGPALITDKGFVGLNQPVPVVQLHVKSEGEMIRAEGPKAAITLSNTGSGFDGFFRITDTIISVGSTSNFYDIALLPDGKPSLIANANTGHVGIGAANNGAATLKVKQLAGGLQLENVTGTHDWEFRVDDGIGNLQLFNDQLGPIPAGTFAPNGIYTPSDKRLKYDIRSMESVLDKIMRLEPVQFRLNYHKTGDPVIGFLAQDVHALFPQLVGEFQSRTGETYQAVNYTGFGVLAIKALQEQQNEIETLKKENQSLRESLLQIERRISKLEITGKQ
jgi:hypothetical protein